MLQPQVRAMILLAKTSPTGYKQCVDPVCMAPIPNEVVDHTRRKGLLARRSDLDNLFAPLKDSLEDFQLSVDVAYELVSVLVFADELESLVPVLTGCHQAVIGLRYQPPLGKWHLCLDRRQQTRLKL